MKLEEAKKKLKLAKAKRKKLNDYINGLREIVWEYGVDPDYEGREKIIPRNKEAAQRGGFFLE